MKTKDNSFGERISNLLTALPSTKARKNLQFILGYQIPNDIVWEVLVETAQGARMKDLVAVLEIENDYMLGKMISTVNFRRTVAA